MIEISPQFISIAMSVGAWITLFLFIVKTAMRFGSLELKVDTMWGFQMRRAMSEVVTSGVGVMNSPLVITDDALAHLDPIKPRLLEWYANYPGKDNDASILLGIESEFGDDILKTVCFPCGLSYGACLIIALVVAKGSNEVDLRVKRDTA
jgi:hypothetical protein